MKLSKSFLPFVLVSVLTVFVVAVAFQVYMSAKPKASTTPELTYSLSSSKTSYVVGEKISVPVYLSGAKTSGTSAFDVKFTYDSTKLKLVDAVPGTFFDKYLTVKWDPKNAWFALAMTPSNPKKLAVPASPLLTLEFTAIGKTDSTEVSTGASTVYVSNTGGFNPQAGTINFSIQ